MSNNYQDLSFCSYNFFSMHFIIGDKQTFDKGKKHNLVKSAIDCESTYERSGEVYCAIPLKNKRLSFHDAKKHCR